MAGRLKKTSLLKKKGFTLAETLLAILILLMVTAVVAAGVPVAVHAYERVVMASNAQMLLSTTMTRMRDELGTATNISITTTVNNESIEPIINYTGDTGRNCAIQFEEGNQNGAGIYLTESIDVASYKHLLVTQQAATKSLYAKYGTVAYDSSKGIVTVTDLQVFEISSGKVIAEAKLFEINILTDRT